MMFKMSQCFLRRNFRIFSHINMLGKPICSSVTSCNMVSHKHLVKVPSVSTNPEFNKLLFSTTVFHRNDKTFTEVTSSLTIEKKLIFLMDEWEVEDAVKLLKRSIAQGDIPNPTIVLNLIQLVANLGEYECLLDLHDLLIAENLITNKNFYKCLQEAYYHSGRVEEGVSMLRILYHKTRQYVDVDVFFVLITVMIMKHFPEFTRLIDDFVEECEEMDDALPMAGLWKAYMLLSDFRKADEMVLKKECIHTHLSQMTADLLSSKHSVEYDMKTILGKLCEVPHIKKKVKALVHLRYMELLCKDHNWKGCMNVLEMAEKSELVFPQGEVKRICDIITALQEEYNSNKDIDSINEFLKKLTKT